MLTATPPAVRPPAPRRGLATALGPNWFAAVMGTGIVANAAVTLPAAGPVLRPVAFCVWVLAAGLLTALCGLWTLQAVRHPEIVRVHATDPVMMQFYGAPPMAVLTVGTGTLLLGVDVLGEPVAVAVATVAWVVGTLAGLASAVAVPYLMFTRERPAPDAAAGSWLMPVVPPMVAAAGGALLLPHVPAGQLRLGLLLACYALFGVSLFASVLVTAQLWQRLVMHALPPATVVPTLWIVLGWLGQSVTAANLLGEHAHLALPEPYATGLAVLGVAYGVPALGFALLWAAIAGAVTLRTARRGLPFAPTWWSFTFPVGTVVTGTSALAVHTGAVALAALAMLGYAGLVAAWVTVVTRVVRAR